MIVLGIETSCDETGAALVDNQHLLSNVLATQAIHEEYGGVVPEFASRAHIKQLVPIIKMALQKADRSLQDIDGIAVTFGPGLAGSLLVGLCQAKGMAQSLNIPWIGINHLEGHILANAVEGELSFPFIALVASGGHTLLIYAREPHSYQIIGQTIDDAAGEAFDKVAKVLHLGYPGGPHVEKAARNGEPNIDFPRALWEKNNLNFSFSGLKTSVLYHVQKTSKQDKEISASDVAASFQAAVVDVLLQKVFWALEEWKCTNLVLAGGVIRNSALRSAFENKCDKKNINLMIPSPVLCTDNAAMIARAGHMRLTRGEQSPLSLDVVPNLSLNTG